MQTEQGWAVIVENFVLGNEFKVRCLIVQRRDGSVTLETDSGYKGKVAATKAGKITTFLDCGNPEVNIYQAMVVLNCCYHLSLKGGSKAIYPFEVGKTRVKKILLENPEEVPHTLHPVEKIGLMCGQSQSPPYGLQFEGEFKIGEEMMRVILRHRGTLKQTARSRDYTLEGCTFRRGNQETEISFMLMIKVYAGCKLKSSCIVSHNIKKTKRSAEVAGKFESQIKEMIETCRLRILEESPIIGESFDQNKLALYKSPIANYSFEYRKDPGFYDVSRSMLCF